MLNHSASANIAVCKKCKKIIDYPPPLSYPYYNIKKNHMLHSEKIFLCKNCQKKLERWFNENGSI